MYKKVYFRLDNNGYSGPDGWREPQAQKRFYSAILALFEADGWKTEAGAHRSGIAPSVFKGHQELYLHPMAASGIVLAEDIPHIESMLRGAETFRHYHTDIYDDYVILSDEAYLLRLEEQRGAIAGDILDAFRTKRRDLYVYGFNLLDQFNQKYRVKRVGTHHQFGDLEVDFISGIFKELLEKGMILSAKSKHGECYRTAKDDEIAGEKSA